MLVGTIEIVKVEGNADLYYKRHDSNRAQPCYLYFDPQQRGVCACYSSAPHRAVTMDVWHHTLFMIPIPALKANAANKLMEELAPKLEKIADGYSCVCKAGAMIGYLTQEAQTLLAEVMDDVAPKASRWRDTELLLDVWNAEEWLGEGYENRLGVKFDSTDEELEKIAQKTRKLAQEHGVDVLEGLDELLLRVRKDAGKAAAKAALELFKPILLDEK